MKETIKIDVFLLERRIEIWNEDFNRWEKSSFQEAGINYEEKYEIEQYLRDEFQERGYDDIEIDFIY